MKNTFVIFCLFSFLFSGCSTFQDVSLKPNTQTDNVVEIPRIELKEKSEKLKNSASIINSTSSDNRILLEGEKIKTVAENLEKDDRTYEKLYDTYLKSEKKVEKLNQKLTEANSKITDSLHEVAGYGLYIGGGFILIGIILTIFSSKIPVIGRYGVYILASGVAIVVVSYSIVVNMTYLAPIGLIIIVGMIIWAVWNSIYDHQDKSTKDYTIVELIKTIEVLKSHTSCWDVNTRTMISKIQSPETKKIVREKKETIINDKTL